MILPDGGSRQVVYVGSEAESVRSALAARPGGGYSVEVVSGPGEARDRLADDATACVLADYDGPDSPVLALAGATRTGDEDRPAVPVVALVRSGADPAAALVSGGPSTSTRASCPIGPRSSPVASRAQSPTGRARGTSRSSTTPRTFSPW